MITSVTVGGVALDPSLALADLVILHGRGGVTDSPQPSGAALTIYQPADRGMPSWSGGAVLELAHENALKAFTGRLTSVSLSHVRQPDGSLLGALQVSATGSVARLGFRTVGDEPWPAEPGAARAGRILALAEVPYLIDGTADAVVLPRDVDSRPALDLLDDVARSTAAAVFDLPSGEVVYQPMKDRARPVHPFPWADFHPDLTWQELDPGMTWQDFDAWTSLDSEFPVVIPPEAVDWEPDWQLAEDTVINHVRVGYGPAATGNQSWTEVVDQASIDSHGRRYSYLGTQLQGLADAQAYASWLLTVRGREQWKLGMVTVRLDALEETTRAAVLSLTCGDHVTIDGMPQPAPATVAEGICEGWTYQQWGVRGQLFNSITLTMSALLESLAVPAWGDYPATFEWSDHHAYLTWADLTSLDSIGV